MASFKDNPVLAELDSIAMELEKTGNADLATLVDECSAEILSTPAQKKASAKPKRKKRRSKKNRKSAASASPKPRKRARIAAAMRKIARAQVSELEDIASELLSEGEKTAALEVLKIAQDLDSDYDYSRHGDHDEPEHKGDADKRYDRDKNLPHPKGDDAHLDYTWEEGEGYPFNEGEKSAFAQQLDELIRLAEEDGGLDLDMGGDDADDMGGDDDDDADDMGEDEEEGEDDDADDLPDLDMGDDMGEDDDDDELAAMMDAMGMGEDVEAADRMYGADEDMDMGGDDDADDLDLGGLDMGDEDEDDMGGEDDMGEEGEDDMDMDMDMDDEPAMDEPEDTEGMDLLPNVDLKGPMGTGLSVASAEDKKRVAALAKKLWKSGQKDLARRVASLVKGK